MHLDLAQPLGRLLQRELFGVHQPHLSRAQVLLVLATGLLLVAHQHHQVPAT